MNMRSQRKRRFLARVAHTAFFLSLAATISADSPPLDTPARSLWERTDFRFVRAWRVFGPVPGTLNTDVLAAQGGEASIQADSIGTDTPGWRAHAAWQDVVSMGEALSTQEYRGTQAAPRVAYAFTVIKRDKESDAVLSLGSDVPTRVWVNGSAVHSAPAAPFTFDRERVRVHFKQGDNSLLLKFEHRSGPWRFALRTLEPGTVLTPLTEIVPQIVSPQPEVLQTRADSLHAPRGPRIQVAVIGAGGRVVAQAQTARGETKQFRTSEWPQGAYEVRFTTQTSSGAKVVHHLPWYNGDAIAAARRFMMAAQSAPADVNGATMRMLADLVRDRLDGSLIGAPDDAWQRIHSALFEMEELQQAASGNGPGGIRPYGFVRVGYVDDVDGSTQFCRAYLPPEYDAAARWPLVVYLHGFNPSNPPYIRWWRVDQRHNRVAERHNVIFVEAHGRGNSQYLGLGEQDVLRCIAEVKRRLSVDEDRVYLTGESMGGSGTWIVGSRHPHLFAAIAPVFGGWDNRLQPQNVNPRATLLSERLVQESQSSFAGAEGLLNVPVFISHGDVDRAVIVENSRHAARMLQRWGYDVRYEEHPGRGHEDLDVDERIAEWLLMHKRVSAPRKVRIRSTDLGGAGAHWIEVLSFENPMDVLRVEAEVIEPGLIRLDTHNAAVLRLKLPAELRGDAEALRVVWNGEEVSASLSSDGQTVLRTREAQADGLVKSPVLSGGLSSLFATPFAIVVGTASLDPATRRLCRQKADALAERWQTWQHTAPRLINDNRLTPEDEQRYSLLLIGGPDDNLVSRRLAAKLPLSITPDSITIDGRTFPARDSVVQMIYPSPSNSERYVLLVAGTSRDGLYFWNPAAFWHFPYGYPTMQMDWVIRDGHRVALENGLGPERGWVASGVFDRAWRRDDRWVFVGEENLRAQSPLRRPPPAGFSVSSQVLSAYPGRYEFAPGIGINITRKNRALNITFADGNTSSLTPETETDFTIDGGGTVVSFQRSMEGGVTSLVINNEGTVSVANRLPSPTS